MWSKIECKIKVGSQFIQEFFPIWGLLGLRKINMSTDGVFRRLVNEKILELQLHLSLSLLSLSQKNRKKI